MDSSLEAGEGSLEDQAEISGGYQLVSLSRVESGVRGAVVGRST